MFVSHLTEYFFESNSLLHFCIAGVTLRKFAKGNFAKGNAGRRSPTGKVKGKFPGFQKCEPSAKTAPRAPLGVRDGKFGSRSFHRAIGSLAGGVLGERSALSKWG